MLVRLEVMRSVNAPPGEVGDDGESFIDVPPKREDLRALARTVDENLPKAQVRLVADELFSLDECRRVSSELWCS